MKKNLRPSSMIVWMKEMFFFNRSLMGQGNYQTLKYLKNINNKLKFIKFNSNKKVFDWTIPKEWVVKSAYFKSSNGRKYCDYKKNNLHLVQYSTKFKGFLSKKDLLSKIHSIPKQQNAIPYITSYYQKNWGFCMAHKEKKMLPEGKYFINIDTYFKKGKLLVGEVLIKGKSKKEIFFSTNICHPSMANNELSGPALSIFLSNYILSNFKNTYYSYRFLFVPETIGSIAYINKNLRLMKKNIICGFVLSCVGDNRFYSHIKSPDENNLADRALEASLIGKKNIKSYKFIYRGSDERQYCSPHVNLPICGFSRSKYGTYKEYHTNKDNFSLVTQQGLYNSFKVLKDIIDSFETCLYPKSKIICEPFLSKRRLMPAMRNKKMYKDKNQLILNNLIAYSDGKRSIFDISKILNEPLREVVDNYKILLSKKLVI